MSKFHLEVAGIATALIKTPLPPAMVADSKTAKNAFLFIGRKVGKGVFKLTYYERKV